MSTGFQPRAEQCDRVQAMRDEKDLSVNQELETKVYR
ncbi:hypothetical protein NIES2135_28700 [Leptolyngbya boryana NIES-2135]|uniref:Uncharacterized protein n=1 Tax=Leptolyngbya boryana NIES-2135 TaxID=1973484 RepID=A0A1Z4JGZ5_LEPBY|nr:hypothetical protein NIES2135_28700 [Leptolyngbya boryana NIES-2135]